MKCLIVDDEPLARDYLRGLLLDQKVEVVGEAEDAADALQKAEALSPDLMFLDIRMPGLDGMQLAASMMHLSMPPLVVFVTGYSDRAVEAFERDAADYLLKPVSADRLAAALVRARARLSDRSLRLQARRTIQRQAAKGAPMERLPIRVDFGVRLVPVQDIVSASARDRRVVIQTREAEWPTYYSLKELEALLPPALFLRIHDSHIVNLKLVDEVVFLGDHSYSVRLSNKQLLPVGRTRCPELHRRLGLTGNRTSPF